MAPVQDDRLALGPFGQYFALYTASLTMAKRHTLHVGDWESIFGRLQELVVANSGEDPFEEILKLLVAKMFDEAEGGERFTEHETAEATASAVNSLLAGAAVLWEGVVTGEPVRLADEHLTICVREVQDVTFMDASLEVLDNLFEHLVADAAKGSKGQYFTPRHVVDACVRIVAPGAQETVIDPACGSGGFLAHALAYVQGQHPDLDVDSYARDCLWGFDFDPRAVRVARALMRIAGAPGARILRLNSLLVPGVNASLFASGDGMPADPDDVRLTVEDVVRTQAGRGLAGGFDVLLANPPFAGEISERPLLSAYEVGHGRGRIERDALFLERCVRLLRPGGRLGIVLPHNKFGGRQWAGLREWLLRHLRVVAVLGLGRETFLPHTHQKAAVLFGVRRDRPLARPPSDESVLFLISERSGKDTRGQIVPRDGTKVEDPAWVRADHDLDALADIFAAHVASADVPWPTP